MSNRSPTEEVLKTEFPLSATNVCYMIFKMSPTPREIRLLRKYLDTLELSMNARAVLEWQGGGNELPGVMVPDEGVDFYVEIDRFERTLISQALKRTKGSLKDAAKLLGMKRTTLFEKARRLGCGDYPKTDEEPLSEDSGTPSKANGRSEPINGSRA